MNISVSGNNSHTTGQFIERQLLSKKELDEIKPLLDLANEHGLWRNGIFSGGGDENRKKNLELYDKGISERVYRLIMSKLDNDLSFFNFTVPKTTNLNIISKTCSGGYYKPHIDYWDNGDYSTTVFLNDPEEYEGGELCLLVNGEEKKFKLPAGGAVTYTTGTVHRVNTVISGVRYVSVFWTKTLIKDPFMRYICGDLKLVQELLDDKIKKNKNPKMSKLEGIGDRSSSIYYDDCITSYNDPKFIVDNLIENILRRYV
jgi:PKHD-type hydroxylase